MAVLAAGLYAGAALAKVPQAQTDRLQKDLTPLGSERAGNADGSIRPGLAVSAPRRKE